MSQRNWVRVRCRECAGFTEHALCAEFESTEAPIAELASGERTLFASTRAQILECRQCKAISFRRGWNDGSDPDMTRWTVYPNPEQRRPCAAAPYLPGAVGRLYRETLRAIDARILTLATAGMRAVVEALCVEKSCGGQDLQEKLSKLKKNGLLGTPEVTALQLHRDWGNGALHRMQTPSWEELLKAWTLLEHVLDSLYALPQHTQELNQLREARLKEAAQAAIAVQRAS